MRDLGIYPLDRGNKSVLDACGLKPKDDALIPQRLAIAMQADGWYIRSMMPFVKRSAMPESCKDRPTNALEYILMCTRSQRYFSDFEAVRVRHAEPERSGNHEGARHRPDESLETGRPRSWGWQDREYNPAGRAFRNTDFWFQSVDSPHGLVGVGDELVGLDVTSDPTSLPHFASFPKALVEPLIKCSTSEAGCCSKCGSGWTRRTRKGDLVMEPGRSRSTMGKKYSEGLIGFNGIDQRMKAGHHRESTTLGFAPSCQCQDAGPPVPAVVCDPFSGLATVLVVARDLGRKSIGVELSLEYAAMSVAHRILGAPYRPKESALLTVEPQEQMRMEK